MRVAETIGRKDLNELLRVQLQLPSLCIYAAISRGCCPFFSSHGDESGSIDWDGYRAQVVLLLGYMA